MMGCIQTLGHLDRVLRWRPYAKIRDARNVIMEGESASYELIEKMIAAFAKNYRSRRIHVGMDEAHDLGRGRSMDLKGYERPFDIFNRHIAKVVDICKRHGLKPMIWSDMYFRMGSKTQDYDDDECLIPDEVRRAIPADVQMVYWDYYKTTVDQYRTMIARHRQLDHEPVVASAVWTHCRTWYDRAMTEGLAGPCVEACTSAGVKELFFTIWGDDGNYCEMDSALAGLAWCAERSWTGAVDEARLAKRYAAICGADYRAVCDAAAIVPAPQSFFPKSPDLADPQPVLSDDPLLGIYWQYHELKRPGFWAAEAKRFRQLAARLKPHARTTEPVDLAYAYRLAVALSAKVEAGLALRRAYAKRKPAELRAAARLADRAGTAITELLAAFRRQWYRRNKPNGFEIIQLRFAGLRERYAEVRRRLDDLAAGRIDRIGELDEKADVPALVGWGQWMDLQPAFVGMNI